MSIADKTVPGARARSRKTARVEKISLSVRILALIKLARPRTWIFAISMWLIAYLSTGSAQPFICLIGVLICAGLTAATNLFNIYTDRGEDRINLPYRVQLVKQLGLPQLKTAIVFSYVLPLILALVFTNLRHTLLCTIGVLNSIFYSWGIRFKAHLFVSLLSISGVVVLPFFAGWSAVHPIQNISPVVFVFGFFFLAYANLKNLPDVSGDKENGIRTVFTLYKQNIGAWLVCAMMIIPYGVLALLIWSDILPQKYLSIFVMMPFLWLFWRGIPKAQTPVDREIIHALGYFYQVLLFMMLFLIYYPTLGVVISLVILFVLTSIVEYLGIDSRPYNLRLSHLLQRRPLRVKKGSSL